MKFKVIPGCALFSTLQEINKGMICASAAIKDTLIQKGFTGNYASSGHSYLVACDAVEILGPKPDAWKVMGYPYQQLYWPLAKNKKDQEWLRILPRISNDILNLPLDFHFGSGPNLEVYYRPGVAWHKEYIVIDTGNATYTPVEGMIEILESEYQKLHATISD